MSLNGSVNDWYSRKTIKDKRKYVLAARECNPNLTENYVQSGHEHKGAQSVTAAAHNPWLIDANSQPLDRFRLQNSSHLIFLRWSEIDGQCLPETDHRPLTIDRPSTNDHHHGQFFSSWIKREQNCLTIGGKSRDVQGWPSHVRVLESIKNSVANSSVYGSEKKES